MSASKAVASDTAGVAQANAIRDKGTTADGGRGGVAVKGGFGRIGSCGGPLARG